MVEVVDVVQIVLIVLLFIVNGVNIILAIVAGTKSLSSYNTIGDFDSIIDGLIHPLGI